MTSTILAVILTIEVNNRALKLPGKLVDQCSHEKQRVVRLTTAQSAPVVRQFGQQAAQALDDHVQRGVHHIRNQALSPTCLRRKGHSNPNGEIS